MDLDALRLKKREELTVPELDNLRAGKDKLSAEEVSKFQLSDNEADGLDAEDRELLAAVKAGKKKVVDSKAVDDNGNDKDEDDMSDEDKQTLADIKAGKKKVVDASDTSKLSALTQADRETLSAIQSGEKTLVDAETLGKLGQLDSLMAMEKEYQHNKADQFILDLLKAGKIKPDQRENTVNMLLSMEGETRKAFEDHLSALPVNETLSVELGHDKNVAVDVNEELKQKTIDTLSKAKANGENLSYGQAQDRLMKEDTDLKQRYEAQRAAN